jgi:hypothetical protein
VLLASIDVGLLFEVVWSAALASVVVSLLFALVVLFGARSGETRRSGRGAASMAYAVGAAVSLAGFGFLVGYAVHIMLSEG